jgi:hypothetical protein
VWFFGRRARVLLRRLGVAGRGTPMYVGLRSNRDIDELEG